MMPPHLYTLHILEAQAVLHVDGGTSRFVKDIVHQPVCAGCANDSNQQQ